jgi:hypothetical protein
MSKSDVIRTEDGVVVRPGDRIYDYYSMKPGIIEPGSITHAPDVWFDVTHDDGTRTILNGQRICTIAWAKAQGWPGA